ncbi:MAG: hypothetical protein LWX70_09740 [Sphingobacteriia bacterium]|nr:hypothetical protein [Sphingobacteriia bacterium]
MEPVSLPRFEYRIFGLCQGAWLKLLMQHGSLIQERVMTDYYILSTATTKHNIKIRNGLMDIKTLEQCHDGLEQWSPFLVGQFPLKAGIIKQIVFPALGIVSPGFDKEEYKLEEFVEEIIKPDPDLAFVETLKHRFGFEFEGCINEYAQVVVNGALIETVAFESEDPEKVKNIIQKLGLSTDIANTNYPKALKKIIGREPFESNWMPGNDFMALFSNTI